MPLLAFDRKLIEIVRSAAQPIPVAACQRFYEAVDRLLRGEPVLGPGAVSRACRKAQAEFISVLDAPPVVNGYR
jgi:hypothetical protein